MYVQAVKYYGSKASFAHMYAVPRFDTIVEPFAGGASYSLRYPWHRVILVDMDERLIAVWRYLTSSVAEARIRALPTLPRGACVDEIPSLCNEERWLIGWWIHTGDHAPRNRPSPHMRGGSDFWGEERRERLARVSRMVTHWEVRLGSYEDVENVQATWFVDPPYQAAGRRYRFGSSRIDYGRLSSWCRARRGQVIVCENEGANWLPFERMTVVNGVARKPSVEVVWNGP